jgi:hypothetical protein
VTIEQGTAWSNTFWTLTTTNTYTQMAGPVLMTIEEIHNNYLIVNYGSKDWYIALPQLIRQDTREGGSVAGGDTTGMRDGDTITYPGGLNTAQTRTVTLTGAGWSPENQIIGPTIYQAGDTILAIPRNQTVAGDTSGTTQVCTHVAMDGRAWGPVPST